jgi:chromate transporter
MNPLLLYLLLLKATMTSFSGLASLPIIRNDLVVRHGALTDRQLNTAVAAGRTGPGPIGLYVVSVGYQAGGIPGAVAGWLAMVTPAFVIIPMIRYLGSRAERADVRRVITGIVLAGAGLILSSSVPLARDAITDVWTGAIAATSLVLLIATRVETVSVLLGGALAGLFGKLF